MVVDASTVVAILRQEPTAARIVAALESAPALLMSSVTLTEVVLIGLKNVLSSSDTVARVEGMAIEIVAVEEELAIAAAEARHRFPIRFGDGFVYALAQARGLPVLTLDTEFRKTDAALVGL